DVAVGAVLGVGGKVAPAFAVVEGEDAYADEDSHQRGEGQPENASCHLHSCQPPVAAKLKSLGTQEQCEISTSHVIYVVRLILTFRGGRRAVRRIAVSWPGG